jgi:hypothetical protein
MKRFLFIIIAIIFIGLAGFIYWRYFWVFGDGVKTGQLNYEGKLIQAGFRSGSPGTVQSYEFEFSVEDDDIAQKLMLNSGKEVDLRYKEYNASVPWRGYSRYIVDSIIAIRDPH